MNKVAEFYAKVIADEATAKEFAEAMGGKVMNELGDAEFDKLGKLAEKLGFTISVEEAKEYLGTKEGELADDELDAVAGGTSGKKEVSESEVPSKRGCVEYEEVYCPHCGAPLGARRCYCSNCHTTLQ